MSEEAQVNVVEDQAMRKGWKPQEEAIKNGVDPEKAVDAKTFLDRAPFINQIKMLDQRNTTMARKFDQLMSRFDQAEVQGYERAITELQAERDEAYEDLDSQRVRELDRQIEEQTKAVDDVQVRQQQNNVPEPEALAFVDHNKDWWNQDVAAMQFSVASETTIKQQNPTWSMTQVYDEVQRRVDSFRGASPSAPTKEADTNKASFVAPPSRGGASNAGNTTYAFNDLTSEAKDVYMSMKQYRKDEFEQDYSVSDFIEAQKKAGITEIDELIR